MKKYVQISVMLGIFFLLVWVRSVMGGDTPTVGQNSQTQTPPTQNTPTSNNASSVPPASQKNQTGSAGSSTTGSFKDGTYTGSTEDAFYGLVQVQAVIQGGKITDVTFLQYPNDNRTTQFINSQAMPMLKSEAIQAQSANVSIISGASDTSTAFQRSLSSALSQAS